jgi:hypothetical protein
MRIVYKMVLSNAPKRVTMASSAVTPYGNKKQGLASTVGVTATVSGVYHRRVACLCPTAYLAVNNTKTCGAPIGGKPSNYIRC